MTSSQKLLGGKSLSHAIYLSLDHSLSLSLSPPSLALSLPTLSPSFLPSPTPSLYPSVCPSDSEKLWKKEGQKLASTNPRFVARQLSHLPHLLTSATASAGLGLQGPKVESDLRKATSAQVQNVLKFIISQNPLSSSSSTKLSPGKVTSSTVVKSPAKSPLMLTSAPSGTISRTAATSLGKIISQVGVALQGGLPGTSSTVPITTTASSSEPNVAKSGVGGSVPSPRKAASLQPRTSSPRPLKVEPGRTSGGVRGGEGGEGGGGVRGGGRLVGKPVMLLGLLGGKVELCSPNTKAPATSTSEPYEKGKTEEKKISPGNKVTTGTGDVEETQRIKEKSVSTPVEERETERGNKDGKEKQSSIVDLECGETISEGIVLREKKADRKLESQVKESELKGAPLSKAASLSTDMVSMPAVSEQQQVNSGCLQEAKEEKQVEKSKEGGNEGKEKGEVVKEEEQAELSSVHTDQPVSMAEMESQTSTELISASSHTLSQSLPPLPSLPPPPPLLPPLLPLLLPPPPLIPPYLPLPPPPTSSTLNSEESSSKESRKRPRSPDLHLPPPKRLAPFSPTLSSPPPPHPPTPPLTTATTHTLATSPLRLRSPPPLVLMSPISSGPYRLVTERGEGGVGMEKGRRMNESSMELGSRLEEGTQRGERVGMELGHELMEKRGTEGYEMEGSSALCEQSPNEDCIIIASTPVSAPDLVQTLPSVHTTTTPALASTSAAIGSSTPGKEEEEKKEKVIASLPLQSSLLTPLGVVRGATPLEAPPPPLTGEHQTPAGSFAPLTLPPSSHAFPSGPAPLPSSSSFPEIPTSLHFSVPASLELKPTAPCLPLDSSIASNVALLQLTPTSTPAADAALIQELCLEATEMGDTTEQALASQLGLGFLEQSFLGGMDFMRLVQSPCSFPTVDLPERAGDEVAETPAAPVISSLAEEEESRKGVESIYGVLANTTQLLSEALTSVSASASSPLLPPPPPSLLSPSHPPLLAHASLESLPSSVPHSLFTFSVPISSQTLSLSDRELNLPIAASILTPHTPTFTPHTPTFTPHTPTFTPQTPNLTPLTLTLTSHAPTPQTPTLTPHTPIFTPHTPTPHTLTPHMPTLSSPLAPEIMPDLDSISTANEEELLEGIPPELAETIQALVQFGQNVDINYPSPMQQ